MADQHTNDDETNLSRLAVDIRHHADRLLSDLAAQRDHLREARGVLTPEQFREWALVELGMDEPTLHDFIAFDGSLDSITDHMTRYFANTHTRGKQS